MSMEKNIFLAFSRGILLIALNLHPFLLICNWFALKHLVMTTLKELEPYKSTKSKTLYVCSYSRYSHFHKEDHMVL